MPNLITQYDNGSFEDVLANWDAEFTPASSAQERDAVTFYEGAHSCKLTTVEISSSGFLGGNAGLLLVRYPGVTLGTYEVKVRVKVSPDMPDDAVLLIGPYANTTQEKKGYTIPVRASQAKNGFVELRANFYAQATAGEAAFFVSVLFNSAVFNSSINNSDAGVQEFYKLVTGYNATSPIPEGVFVWIDAMSADVKAIPDLPNLQFVGRRLYYIQNVFYISINGVRTIVDEPIKWDDLNIEVVFDEKTKAYRFEFSDKDILLEFDRRAGGDILASEYKKKGVNASAQLLFGEYDPISGAGEQATVPALSTFIESAVGGVWTNDGTPKYAPAGPPPHASRVLYAPYDFQLGQSYKFKYSLGRRVIGGGATMEIGSYSGAGANLQDKIDIYLNLSSSISGEFTIIPTAPMSYIGFKVYSETAILLEVEMLTLQAVKNGLTIHYKGDINFEDCIITDKVFKCNIERQSFGEKLRTYFDTRVDLFRERSLGGLVRPPLTLSELFLHPRLLSYVGEFNYNQKFNRVYLGQNLIFDASDNTITVMRVISIANGDVFKILNATGGAVNGTYNVTDVEIPLLHDRTIITVAEDILADGTGTGDVDIVDEFEMDPQQFSDAIGDDGIVYTVIPPLKETTNNIDGLSEPTAPDGLLIYVGPTLPAGVLKRTFAIDLTINFKYTKTASVQQPLAGFGVIRVGNISGGGSPDGIPIGVGNPLGTTKLGPLLGGTDIISGNIQGSVDLYADEALFIRCTIYNPVEADPATVYSAFEFVDVDTIYLKIREQTVFPPSLIRAPRIHEMVNRQLELIVDKANVLRSDLLGRIDLGYDTNGCASNHFGMDGKILRNFINKSFNLSAKDCFNSIDGIFCAGMSIERDNDENESIRLEELPYFFRDILLLDLPIITKYEKKPAAKYLFNEMEFGFKKYPQDNQQDSLEDFHTKISVVTPLTKIKNKLTNIIDAILSGYYIEYTRQQSFEVNPTNAYETDNDLFYISAKQSQTLYEEEDITFDNDNNAIILGRIIPVVVGDTITIENATGGVTAGVFKIAFVQIPFAYNGMTLIVEQDLPSDGAGTGDLTITNAAGEEVSRFEAKRNEDFEVVTGVTFPASAYNLEHHLKRIAIRWAKVFQAGWAFLIGGPDEDAIGLQFTEGANNTEARTRYKDTVACRYGDEQRLDRKDSQFEAVSRMDKPLFDKDEITFEAPLTWALFNYVRKAYEGRNPDGKDYGYFQFKNPDGDIERGWAIKLKFKPTTQMLNFTLIKKYDG